MHWSIANKAIMISSAVFTGGLITWLFLRQRSPNSFLDNSIHISKMSKQPLTYLGKEEIIEILLSIKASAREELTAMIRSYKSLRRQEIAPNVEYFNLIKKMQK